LSVSNCQNLNITEQTILANMWPANSAMFLYFSIHTLTQLNSLKSLTSHKTLSCPGSLKLTHRTPMPGSNSGYDMDLVFAYLSLLVVNVRFWSKTLFVINCYNYPLCQLAILPFISTTLHLKQPKMIYIIMIYTNVIQ